LSTQPHPQPQPVSAQPEKKASRWSSVGILALCVLGVALICCTFLVWYASTPQFENKVREYVVASAEQATGGRVELQGFRWRLLHLEVELQNLTIHGLEAPNETPYLHIDNLRARAKIISFLSPKIGLNLLEAQHPVFHLIVYPDGTTNQPKPKQKRNGKPLKDTLFDLGVDQTIISNGLLLINQKATPFDISGKDLLVAVVYQPGANHTDRYIGNFSISDLMTRRGKSAPVHSHIDLNVELARNAASLKSFRLVSGASSLTASGTLSDFNHPQWSLVSSGDIDIRELDALVPVEGLERGTVSLNLKGQGSEGAKLDITGDAKLKATTYRTEDVDLRDVNARTHLHATQDELALTGVRADLPSGGHVDGDFRLLNWLSSGTTAANQVKPGEEKKVQQQGIIRATLNGVALRTIMSAVAPSKDQELGFDTLVSGPTNVDWTGTSRNLTVDGKLQFTPSRQTPPGEVPLSGTADAIYEHRSGTVQIRNVALQTPGSKIAVTGGLGVYPITRASQVSVDLTTSNLSEFDKTLSILGLNSGQKHGSEVLPVRLQGQAAFHGTVTQSLEDPDVKGHVSISNFLTQLSTKNAANVQPPTTEQTSPARPAPGAPEQASLRTLQWDSLDGNIEYSSRAVIVQQATVNRGKAVIHASGQLLAHNLNAHTSRFDKTSGIDANIQIQNASVPDVLVMVGENVPVTGTITFQSHIGGQLNNLSGSGHITVQGGQIYGESYSNLAGDLVFAKQEVGFSRLMFLQNGGRMQGNGGYDFQSKAFHFQATGSGFDLGHYQKIQNSRYHVAGKLNFQLQGKGTANDPLLTAQAHLANLTLAGEPMGAADLDAHTQQQNLLYHISANLKSAHLEATGQTGMEGDYVTQANLNFSQFDIDSLLKFGGITSVSGHSAIAGLVTVSGPAKRPRQMNGEAKISQLALTLRGISLKSEGPLHATLQNGTLHLDPLHITGEDTDLRANGNVGVFDRHDLKMLMQGSVNMALATTLDPDLNASGMVNFNLDAAGTVAHPDLRGNVQFKNVAMAMTDFPNGLSQMNGNLQFNQDRLEVKTLTAMTGGGQLALSGYLTYQAGLYGDLTATGKSIRIRYPQGISSVADASLRLQGSQNNLILSGNVLITRFAMNPNLDLASFAGSSNSIASVPNPNALSSHVRLDVRIMSAPQLNFQNSFAKLAGDVDLRVRGTLANPSILGRITVTEGSATFAGTEYQLQHGEIFFTNPVRIEPTIDLNAIARVEDYDITIGVHGTPNKLGLSYRSEPPLPQADVLSLLALGRTQDEQQYYSAQQTAAGINPTTDAILGGALNATVSNRVQKLFGVGSVKIDPSYTGSLGSSMARITVEQQVSKDVTLTYATNVNSTAQQLVQAQINLTRNVSLVALRDEAGVFSMVVKVHRRYK
jgi:translocation and assembly module TamB